MIKTKWKIKVGDMIHVRTHYKYGVMNNVSIKSGKVVASERHDPVGTFRLVILSIPFLSLRMNESLALSFVRSHNG
jgi:hypothetical protein